MVSQSLFEPMITPTSGLFLSTVKGPERYLSPGRRSRRIQSFGSWLAVLCSGALTSLLGAGGCSAPPARIAAPALPVSAAPSPPPPAAPSPLRLTAEEQLWQRELEGHVRHLGIELGERSTKAHWELADAADYIATSWENLGYTLERQGYDVGDVVAQNLEVSLPGTELGDESVIVGAHYDTPEGKRGTDTATGVAALLVISKMFQGAVLKRRLRFVAYALGEPPHVGQDSMGSLRHAKKLVEAGDKVRAVVNLDSLGRFSQEPASQKALTGIDQALPSVGNFLLALGAEGSESVRQAILEACPRASGVELLPRSYRGQGPPQLAADDLPYRQAGMATVLVTDTKDWRLGPDAAAVGQLDFVRMTRFVSCLKQGITTLVESDDPA